MDEEYFTWVALPHLPKVPQHFLDRMMEIAIPTQDGQTESLVQQGTFSYEYRNRDITYKGKKQKTRVQERLWVGEDWEEWVRTNIITDFWETSVRVSGGPVDVTVHGAHTDGRVCRLYYLVSTGGDNVITNYYRAPNSPVMYAVNHPKVVGYDNMDELEVISSTSFPLGSWILHNGYVLHGVENITGRRVNIDVSIKLNQAMELIEQTKNYTSLVDK